MARIGRHFQAHLLLFSLAGLQAHAQTEKTNIVPNPGFEKGAGGRPTHWTFGHPLTHAWKKGGPSGRYLQFNTDVNAKALAEGSTVDEEAGGQYATVGAAEGVRSWSVPIEVEAGRTYLLQVDAKGPKGSPFVYLKGFRRLTAEEAAEHGELRFFRPVPEGPAFSLLVGGTEKRRPVGGDYLQTYRARLVCHLPGDGTWRRFSRTLKLRVRKDYRADVVVLMPYAYWPPGKYAFDNLVLRAITEEEAKQWQTRRTKNGVPLEK